MKTKCYVMLFLLVAFTLITSGCKNAKKNVPVYVNPTENITMDELIACFKGYTEDFTTVRDELIIIDTTIQIYKNSDNQLIIDCDDSSIEKEIKNNEQLMSAIERIMDCDYIRGIANVENESGHYFWYESVAMTAGYLASVENKADMYYGTKTLIDGDWYYVEMAGE